MSLNELRSVSEMQQRNVADHFYRVAQKKVSCCTVITAYFF